MTRFVSVFNILKEITTEGVMSALSKLYEKTSASNKKAGIAWSWL